MNQEVFLEKLAGILQLEPRTVTPTLALTEDHWDSLAVLSAIALIDELAGLTVPAQKLRACATVDQVLELVRREAEQTATAT